MAAPVMFKPAALLTTFNGESVAKIIQQAINAYIYVFDVD